MNVIREDPRNASLLYLGTEFAFYLSLDGGASWKRFMTGLPTVRIDDILVHPRENDLIVGTHGRSLYILDDITPLQERAGDGPRRETTAGAGPSANGNGGGSAPPAAQAPADAHVFDVRPAVQWLRDVTLSRTIGAAKHFRGENAGAGTYISYHLRAAAGGGVKLTVVNAEGRWCARSRGPAGPGSTACGGTSRPTRRRGHRTPRAGRVGSRRRVRRWSRGPTS